MALTRPRLGQLNTSVVAQADPITVLNQGASSANIDVGFLFNRANGLVSNVALYWSEASQSIVTAYTTNSGSTNANISVASYANLTVGNVLLVTGSILNVQGNIAANTTGILYGNVNSSGNVSTSGNVYASSFFYANGTPFTSSSYGNVQMLANLAAGSNPVTFGGNIVAASGTTSSSTTTGAVIVTGGVGVSGNLYAGGNIATGYHYITPTSVADLAGGTYGTAIAVPGNNWGIYANIGQTGTYYLRQVIGKDSGNNIVIGHVNTGLNANVNVYSGTGGGGVGGSFNVMNPVTGAATFTVNTVSNTVVISNTQTSTSNVTGALVVAGGVGVAGNINATGNIYAVGTNTRHGYTWANSVSSAYTVFNSATNSIDTVFG